MMASRRFAAPSPTYMYVVFNLPGVPTRAFIYSEPRVKIYAYKYANIHMYMC